MGASRRAIARRHVVVCYNNNGCNTQLNSCAMQPLCAKMGDMETTSFDQLLMDVIREMGVLRPEQVLPGWSLSLSEIYALNILAERAPISQQDLGAALLLEKSSVTRLVQQLEQRGWILRERDARDSRLRLLRLPPMILPNSRILKWNPWWPNRPTSPNWVR